MSPTPPTYPARPVNGGPLPQALRFPKPGRWLYSAKLNGWRALVHTPTGTMFNRKLERLSIEHEFRAVLDRLKGCAIEWLDCEALERRLPIGKGSLVVLDAPGPGTYDERQQHIWDRLGGPTHTAAALGSGVMESWPHEHFAPEENKVLSLAYEYEVDDNDSDMHPLAAWERLQAVNKALGCELFEGLVAKRADSLYPMQLRSPDEECKGWFKHRWAF